MAKIIDIETSLDRDGELEVLVDAYDGEELLWLSRGHLEKIAAAFGYALAPLRHPKENDRG